MYGIMLHTCTPGFITFGPLILYIKRLDELTFGTIVMSSLPTFSTQIHLLHCSDPARLELWCIIC